MLLRVVAGPSQQHTFQHDFVPRGPNAKPKKYRYPAFYDPYVGPALVQKLTLPKLQHISTEGMDLAAQAGPAGGAEAEEKKAEKTAFDVKLEKFDAAAKIISDQGSQGFHQSGIEGGQKSG
ncbi:hypothetical protein TIFTF001_015076 [Ficus carica]|uniref:Uncharacterized protein n=1 Tax=Ficus carica TaxID=3494 RepID=A0AA88A505_FICCA|nr:hypothetical protein TIFTF001_015076 [Ficus carica]